MMNEVSQFVSNVGFPIFAFCAMFYMCEKTLTENTKAITDCMAFMKSLHLERFADDEPTNSI